MDAAASPLPKDESTPPVMKMNLVFKALIDVVVFSGAMVYQL